MEFTSKAAMLLGALTMLLPRVALADAAPPASATGRLYITHPSGDEVDHASPLSIDGKGIRGGVGLGACVYFDLPPGSYSLRAMSMSGLDLDLAAGDVKFVELEGTRKDMGGGSELDTVSPKLVRKIRDMSICTSAPPP